MKKQKLAGTHQPARRVLAQRRCAGSNFDYGCMRVQGPSARSGGFSRFRR
jgi:hypothetical protein